MFFGVNADIEYLAEWIDNFVGRHNRWVSPKYLKGESYATNRVAGLARRLQSAHTMYLRQEDLATSNEHIRDFILQSVTNGESAAY